MAESTIAKKSFTTENVTTECTNVANISERLLLKNDKTMSLYLKLTSGINGMTHVFTIPTKYCPSTERMYLEIGSYSSADTSKVVTALVQSDGLVYVQTSSATANYIYVSGTWLLL